MDGSTVPRATPALATAMSRRLEQWSRTVTDAVPSEADRATRSAVGRWRVAGVGLRAVGQGHARPDRRSAAQPTAVAERSAREWQRLGRLFPAHRPSRRVAPRTGRHQPGRGVGVHDRRRPDAGDRRLRRSAACAVASQGHGHRCDCSPRRPPGRPSAPTSSATSRGRCCSTTSS